MSKFREVYIEKEKTLANSGSLVTDLSLADPISEIQLKFAAKNSTSYNKDSPLARCVSKIEIVDGSDVLYSLNGMLAQAMSCYQTRRVPSMQRQAGPSKNQEDHIVIRFGRHLWDKDYALVPANFRNLQLKVTWDLATINTVGVTGFLTDTGKLSIIARIMEAPGLSPLGFMMAKNHYDWTTAASGDERIVLPTDYPYVLFLLRAWEEHTKLYSTITNLKLSIDQDKDIPFDLDSWDLLKMMENEYGKFLLDQNVFGGNEDNIHTWLAVGENAAVVPEPTVAASGVFSTHVNLLDLDGGKVNLRAVGTDHSTTSPTINHLIAIGQGLHHTFAYPFGIMDDPESWLDALEFKDIKAIITQGNAGAAASLALLQARSY